MGLDLAALLRSPAVPSRSGWAEDPDPRDDGARPPAEDAWSLEDSEDGPPEGKERITYDK